MLGVGVGGSYSIGGPKTTTNNTTNNTNSTTDHNNSTTNNSVGGLRAPTPPGRIS